MPRELTHACPHCDQKFSSTSTRAVHIDAKHKNAGASREQPPQRAAPSPGAARGAPATTNDDDSDDVIDSFL